MKKKVQALVLGTMCLALTIGICVQLRTIENNAKTSKSLELNDLKTQVLKIMEKYNDSYKQLINAQDELEKVRGEVTNSDEQLKNMKEKIDKYNVLLGVKDLKGRGVKITISDVNSAGIMRSLIDSQSSVVTDIDILEVVNELKNAGAEAIEVNGQRILNNTSICYEDSIILINGKKVSSPYTINAIGSPEIMATLTRPGGYLPYRLEEEKHLKTTFKEEKEINIKKYIGITNFKYAKSIKNNK